MNVIILLPIQVVSIFHINNLTISHLYNYKYIDHSPFICFSNKASISNIMILSTKLKYFCSPFFSDMSSLHQMNIRQSSFMHFVHSSIYVNGQSYIDKTFNNNVDFSSSTNFTKCTFIINSEVENFYFSDKNRFIFDNCFFLNSSIEFPLIEFYDADLIIKSSIFSQIKLLENEVLISNNKQDSSIKLENTNFTHNHFKGAIINVASSKIQLNRCYFHQNVCESNLICFKIKQNLIQNFLDDIIITENQLNCNDPSEIMIFYAHNDIISISQLIINDEILQSSSDNYYHITILKGSGITSQLYLSNCCLSNPREKWVNGEFNDVEGNYEKDDCFEVNKVHYGIIGTEVEELQIPKRLMRYFQDND